MKETPSEAFARGFRKQAEKQGRESTRAQMFAANVVIALAAAIILFLIAALVWSLVGAVDWRTLGVVLGALLVLSVAVRAFDQIRGR